MLRILLVEDNQIQAGLAGSFLEMGLPDHKSVRARSLKEARACLQREAFDLVLLDLGLPDGEGLEVVLAVKEDVPDLPIVVLTSQNEEGLGPLCIQAGATDFLSKRELTPQALVKAVEYGASRKTEAVTLQLSRQVEELRSVCCLESSPFTNQFGERYVRLLTQPNMLRTAAHKELVAELFDSGLTGSEMIALHCDCLEMACREADERARVRYLQECRVLLMTTMSLLMDCNRVDAVVPATK